MSRTKVLIFVFSLFGLFCAKEMSAQTSTIQRVNGKDTLVSYADVPDLVPSEFYNIRIRSAASNNEWVVCYANISRNFGHLVSPLPGKWGATRNYAALTIGWSHTYCNFEMSKNSPVEVEISSKNDFKINGSNFIKASVHPSHKASKATVDAQGVIRFIISNPALVTVDINGQMDDYKVIDPTPGVNVTDVNRARVHTISIFANPIMLKPGLQDANIVYVQPGIKPSSNLGAKTTLYFMPGVHDIGMNFKVQAGKKYYIPGDAIVYGTFNTLGQPSVGGLGVGERILFYGYGTLSGDKINHPDYDELSYVPTEDQKKPYKPFHIDAADFSGVVGLFVSNSAYHSIYINGDKTYTKWVKLATWRGNGDGIGNCNLTEDCFIRTNDDNAYIKGNKRRCVFWKDAGGAIFHMAGIPENTPLVIEDCDVLYIRGLYNAGAGKGIFVQRGRGTVGQRSVNVLIKDFRIHDKFPNEPIFSLVSNEEGSLGSSYKGITFQNVTAAAAFEGYGTGKSEQIMGTVESPWYGGIIFKDCSIAGKPLSINNFAINQYVKDIQFINTLNSIESVLDSSLSGVKISLDKSNSKLLINSSGQFVNKVQLIDISGKVVFNSDVSTEFIDLEGVEKGCYIVRAQVSGVFYSTKIVLK